jgi:parallel beta-helix repeat protein
MKSLTNPITLGLCVGGVLAAQTSGVKLERDGQRVEISGRIEAPAGVLADADGDGVLWIAADGVVVDLVGELRGSALDADPDAFTGVGIRITGRNVTLRGARVSGYKVAIHALGAEGLVLEDCDVSGNFRQRLHSTKEKEAEEDWLDPHHNDAREWFTRYGAGIYVERSPGVTVRRCRARRGQNGLVLDRCDAAQVHDNDFSFLSGWGIALWRSSDNVLARNACDFCIRGYSHGVYNRGQDSAGILLFEQCSRNAIAENSATHCGDGFFAFAGQEALGGVQPPSADFDYVGRGNNANRIWRNDFSYAAAHGLELTFSFDNRIVSNRFVGNAICGIWAGYSRRTLIEANEFEANGDAGYGLERGGINIEHGRANLIRDNRFRDNACGVHLWWDEDAHLGALPWVKANGHASKGEQVFFNAFDRDKLGIQLRGPIEVILGQGAAVNRFMEVGRDLEQEASVQVGWFPSGPEDRVDHSGNPLTAVSSKLPGPVSDGGNPVRWNASRRGRELIQMDAWGPHELAVGSGSK